MFHTLGLEILAFPCNQFDKVDDFNPTKVQQWASKSHNVTYNILDEVDVYGKRESPLFKWLQDETGELIIWNFSKFLLNSKGKVIVHNKTEVSPLSMGKDIEKLLR